MLHHLRYLTLATAAALPSCSSAFASSAGEPPAPWALTSLVFATRVHTAGLRDVSVGRVADTLAVFLLQLFPTAVFLRLLLSMAQERTRVKLVLYGYPSSTIKASILSCCTRTIVSHISTHQLKNDAFYSSTGERYQ